MIAILANLSAIQCLTAVFAIANMNLPLMEVALLTTCRIRMAMCLRVNIAMA